MTTWPNWVDLIVITLLVRGCYIGFARGLLTELLYLSGAVCVTVLTVNYAQMVTDWLKPWLSWVNPTLATSIVFWLLFLITLFMVHQLIKALTSLMKWEQVNWFLQGIGVGLGGFRGLWWSGFLLIVLVSSGVTYLQASVEERSVLGPRLATLSRETLERVADRFPGAEHRAKVLVPPIKSEK